MAKITSYTKNNQTFWMWKGYLGTVDGRKIVNEKHGFTSEPKAIKDFEMAKAEFITGINTHNESKLSFESVANDWLDQYENTVQPSTFLKVKNQFKLHIIPAFERKQIADITIYDVQKVVNGWFKEFTKYREFKNNVNRVFKYALNQRMITVNPVDSIIVPRPKNVITEDKPDNFYEKSELELLLSAIDNDKIMVALRILAFTGLRKGELLALRWSDIDLNNATLDVKRAITRTSNGLEFGPTKNKQSVRTIDIDPITLKIIKHWKTAQKAELLKLGLKPVKEQLVLSSETNGILSPSKPGKWINVTADRVELKHITVHGMRHTHASLMFESGISIKEAQVRLGHSSYQTTADIYTHVTKKQKMETGKKFAEYVNF